MRLPNGEQAVVSAEKLIEYCLNTTHPRGQHKARVFQAALGFNAANYDLLRRALLNAAVVGDAFPMDSDDFGQRFVLEFEMDGPKGRATVRSLWIIRAGESVPRLTSCYVR